LHVARLATVALAFLALSVGSAAAEQITPTAKVARCLSAEIFRPHLSYSSIRDELRREGYDLTPVQLRVLSIYLASYNGYHRPSLNGLGLTSDQVGAISRVIEQQVAPQRSAYGVHPDGWPCESFGNAPAVVKFVRAQLVYNGFRPSTSFTLANPRQINLVGIQDGQEIHGIVVKSGPREITLQLSGILPANPGEAHLNPWTEWYRYAVSFAP
jgi:hypothetical protein